MEDNSRYILVFANTPSGIGEFSHSGREHPAAEANEKTTQIINYTAPAVTPPRAHTHTT